LRFFLIISVLLTCSGCLTAFRAQKIGEAFSLPPKVKTASIVFRQESHSFTGRKTIFSEEDSSRLRQEFADVLKEFGVEEVKQNGDVVFDAQLIVNDLGCATLFIESNCWLTLLAGPASIYLLPTSMRMRQEVSLTIKGEGRDPVVGSNFTEVAVHVHLALLPLAPYEVWKIYKADFRKDLYRSILREKFRDG
jgi:hypothetical protein